MSERSHGSSKLSSFTPTKRSSFNSSLLIHCDSPQIKHKPILSRTPTAPTSLSKKQVSFYYLPGILRLPKNL